MRLCYCHDWDCLAHPGQPVFLARQWTAQSLPIATKKTEQATKTSIGITIITLPLSLHSFDGSRLSWTASNQTSSKTPTPLTHPSWSHGERTEGQGIPWAISEVIRSRSFTQGLHQVFSNQWHCNMVHGWARLSSPSFWGGGVAHAIGSTKTLKGRYCWWTCFLSFFCYQTKYPIIFKLSDKNKKHIFGIHPWIYAFWTCPSTVVQCISSRLNHHHGWWSACPGVHRSHSSYCSLHSGRSAVYPGSMVDQLLILLGDCHCQTTFV